MTSTKSIRKYSVIIRSSILMTTQFLQSERSSNQSFMRARAHKNKFLLKLTETSAVHCHILTSFRLRSVPCSHHLLLKSHFLSLGFRSAPTLSSLTFLSAQQPNEITGSRAQSSFEQEVNKMIYQKQKINLFVVCFWLFLVRFF